MDYGAVKGLSADMIHLQVKTSLGPYIFKWVDFKNAFPLSSTQTALVFDYVNINPKQCNAWIIFTHGANKGSDIIYDFYRFVERDFMKTNNPVTIADVPNSKYFNAEISACNIKTPGDF